MGAASRRPNVRGPLADALISAHPPRGASPTHPARQTRPRSSPPRGPLRPAPCPPGNCECPGSCAITAVLARSPRLTSLRLAARRGTSTCNPLLPNPELPLHPSPEAPTPLAPGTTGTGSRATRRAGSRSRTPGSRARRRPGTPPHMIRSRSTLSPRHRLRPCRAPAHASASCPLRFPRPPRPPAASASPRRFPWQQAA
jgi:hypothetical protein